jgi:hypothetical protein
MNLTQLGITASRANRGSSVTNNITQINHLANSYEGTLDPAVRYPIGELRGTIHEKISPVGDLWMLIRWMERIQTCAHRPKIILYMPVDSGPLDPASVSRICGSRRGFA